MCGEKNKHDRNPLNNKYKNQPKTFEVDKSNKF